MLPIKKIYIDSRQKNFIPLKYVPLKIELSLVGSAYDLVVSIYTVDNILDPLPAGGELNFYKVSTSTNWAIQNPKI
ncbi:MAG: hypothetical protein ACKPKO_33055 [Candidatus Fonsibacter sp.]